MRSSCFTTWPATSPRVESTLSGRRRPEKHPTASRPGVRAEPSAPDELLLHAAAACRLPCPPHSYLSEMRWHAQTLLVRGVAVTGTPWSRSSPCRRPGSSRARRGGRRDESRPRSHQRFSKMIIACAQRKEDSIRRRRKKRCGDGLNRHKKPCGRAHP